ncbi:dynactin subunit 1-like isoform X2 [Dreissena polymorpha]|uniref:dynactin subunit 1-like isoform X2 n=1 Tax=Dreissena polymorpha TaxID=45954 RepID=UPI002264F6E3|nr:dynactin subunit 1-like isoform X2 [Dreissena polymorpha]
MAEKTMKMGTRVEVIGKGVVGTVAYMGTTMFSAGKWIGVVLDEAKGKNDGTVQGKTYFTCPDNHGIFVRQSQIQAIDDDGPPTTTSTTTSLHEPPPPSEPSPPETPKPSGLLAPISSGVPAPTPSSGLPTPSQGQRSIKKSGLRPPSYAGKGAESEVAATPKRATSIPKDLAVGGTTPAPRSKEGSPALLTRPESKESLNEKAPSLLARPASKESLNEKTPDSRLRKPGASKGTGNQTPTPPSQSDGKTENEIEESNTNSSIQDGHVDIEEDSEFAGLASDILHIRSPAVDLRALTTSIDSQMTNLQQQQEIEGLRAEVKDLNEKLETLMAKRAEDRLKLKESEKTKIQLQQLQEYKSKMQESNADLQRQLLAAKKEARDSSEAFEQYKEEMSDLAETVEIATLDKEMAEEKCEALQQELEQYKEKCEELQVDMEILKNEISDKGTDGVATDFTVKQLNQQIERLKEALVKMRDLSNQEKHDNAKLQKQTESMTAEMKQLRKDKERLSGEVAQLQEQHIELQEQVDAALGAEEMVEQLTEKNLTLEEKMNELHDEKADLEAMNEMNEELQENARVTELELREEVDLSHAKTIEAVRKLEAMQETISDYEKTINKFRELVSTLQETIRELKSKEGGTTEAKVETPSMDMMDFKTKFAETKAFAKTIDMELRKLDVQQANTHVQLLQSFMSESFLKRGGDHDAILVLLMIPRIIAKSDLLATQVRDKYELLNSFDKSTVLKSHQAEQSSFANHMILILSLLQSVMRQYDSALKTCSVDLFLKVGTLLPEMAAHEKSLDHYIDLLRKDQLDETTSVELLEKSINFFQQLYSVHLSGEEVNCTTFMNDQTRLVLSACECITTDIGRLKVLILPGHENTEISILLRDLENYNNDARMCARKIFSILSAVKRRLPQGDFANTATPLNFSKEIQELITTTGGHMLKVAKTLQFLAAGSVQQAALLTDGTMDLDKFKDTEGLMPKKLEEIAYQASDKVYGKEDTGPYECLRLSFGVVVGTMNRTANAMENGEYDFDGTVDKRPVPPVVLRSNTVKAQISDIEALKVKMENKEESIKELKKQLKIKQEEISEQQLRVGQVEKKLETASRDSEEKVDIIQRKLDDTTNNMRKKEKEFEQTMDALQADIDTLEQEKQELKERLSVLSKKTLLEGLSRQAGHSAASSAGALSPSSSFSAQESPVLLAQIDSLKQALHHSRLENVRLSADGMREQMARLPPLRVPRKSIGRGGQGVSVAVGELPEGVPGKMELGTLAKQTSELLKTVNSLSCCPRVIDISKRKPGVEPISMVTNPKQQLVNKTATLTLLEKKTNELQVQVTHLLAANRTGGQVRTDFSVFPTPEFARVLHEKSGDSVLVGRITVPMAGGAGQTIPLNVNADQLLRFHSIMITSAS